LHKLLHQKHSFVDSRRQGTKFVSTFKICDKLNDKCIQTQTNKQQKNELLHRNHCLWTIVGNILKYLYVMTNAHEYKQIKENK